MLYKQLTESLTALPVLAGFFFSNQIGLLLHQAVGNAPEQNARSPSPSTRTARLAPPAKARRAAW